MVKECRSIALDNRDIGIRGFSDQLTRASLSIPLNIAEGISRFSVKEKLNFLRIAKGSAFECVSCLDVLKEVNAIKPEHYKYTLDEFSQIGKMLSGLIRSVQQRQEFKKD